MNRSHRLIVIAAPSGAGKTTLCQRLLQDIPKLTLSISSTTRAPRGKEKEGIDYFFLPKEQFMKQIKEGRFAEWALVHENYYGTSKAIIEQAFQENRPVLLDIDVQGADQLQKVFPDQCLRIFIMPPDLQELEKRLRTRKTDTEDAIQKRLTNAKKEMERGQSFNHIIVNDSLEEAYTRLRKLVESEIE